MNGFCGGVVIVDLLLDKDGTSSTDIRIEGPGSPKENDLGSVLEEVAVPSRGVLSETWLLLNPWLEKEDPLKVSGVINDC
jgi:hypothetical protein